MSSTDRDPSLEIPPFPVVIRFTPTRPRRLAREAVRDLTFGLALAWAMAEVALWLGGA